MPRSLPVYLVHWNAPEWCGSAARSLLASEGVVVDLTVVDNGQSGGPALDDLLPDRVRVLRTPSNVGYAGAANIGLSDWLSHSPASDFCVVGSHDLHVEPTTLARLVDDAMLNSSMRDPRSYPHRSLSVGRGLLERATCVSGVASRRTPTARA